MILGRCLETMTLKVGNMAQIQVSGSQKSKQFEITERPSVIATISFSDILKQQKLE